MGTGATHIVIYRPVIRLGLLIAQDQDVDEAAAAAIEDFKRACPGTVIDETSEIVPLLTEPAL